MAEYWKSTPKYWCKFCQTYVRDTKFERQQHEATGKHQSSIQRSLRDLHRTREREDREKQRAKDEVARLNGLAGAASSSVTPSSSSSAGKKAAPLPPPRQATAEERKRQLKQLAELGVAVPDEFRGEMALAGEWQTVAAAKPAEPHSNISSATGAPLNVGVRSKRKAEGDPDADEELDELTGKEKQPARKPGWGQSFKAYPGAKAGDVGDDIEALLSGAKVKTEAAGAGVKKEEETEEGVKKEDTADDGVKKEEEADNGVTDDPVGAKPKLADIPPIKTEEAAAEEKDDAGAAAGGVVFKKRKSKAMRQK
ncbi:Formin binding protein [Neofusicoccum parvum]|uniref:Formin binding protein n=1 Tax=Neofusicoccum parvum TaxID=310453 RepID=A0ACB5RYB9_9PEZI|nr:Formin binding protein [Neofusicoccum parvum]